MTALRSLRRRVEAVAERQAVDDPPVIYSWLDEGNGLYLPLRGKEPGTPAAEDWVFTVRPSLYPVRVTRPDIDTEAEHA